MFGLAVGSHLAADPAFDTSPLDCSVSLYRGCENEIIDHFSED